MNEALLKAASKQVSSSTAALELSLKIAEDAHEQRTKAAAAAPAAVNTMVELHLIPADRRETALEKLANHSETLNVMVNALNKLNATKTAEIKELQTKLAGYQGVALGSSSDDSEVSGKPAQRFKVASFEGTDNMRLNSGEVAPSDVVISEFANKWGRRG